MSVPYRNHEERVSTRLKIAALWTTIMFIYVYGDLIGYIDPKTLRQILDGNMGPFGPISETLKLSFAVAMSIPAAMIFLTLGLKPKQARWLNIAVGGLEILAPLYTLTMPSSLAYKYAECMEALATTYLVWMAWKWRASEEEGQANAHD